MKKLLLLAVLAMGTTSFAVVSGSPTQAEMPIKVRGTVIDKTGDNLVIEPIKNAGVDGASMEFDFGSIVQGEKQSLEGTFKAYRAKKSVLNNDLTKIKVGILDAAGTSVTANGQTVDVGGKVGVTADYQVNYAVNGDKTGIDGAITVNVSTTDGATTGVFLDITKKLAVMVEAIPVVPNP